MLEDPRRRGIFSNHEFIRAMTHNRPTRRRFLRDSALLSAPLILPSRVWAQRSAPGKRLTLGIICLGRMGRVHLANTLPRDDVEVLAVCEVDTARREDAKRLAHEAYSDKAGATYRGCRAYNDFREVLTRPDIDAVIIATPDHWHAYMAIAAVKAGKDVYCEKPLTHNIHESLEIVNAVRQTSRVLQVGSMQRSSRMFRVSCELVRNGILGRLSAIHFSCCDPAIHYKEPGDRLEPGLDWELWCGPGPLVPYSRFLAPRGVLKEYLPDWRGTWEFGGGPVTNWGAHNIDIAHWALDMDRGGPVEVRAPEHWKTAKRGAQLVYPDGVVLMHVRGRGNGLSFYGTEGELHLNRGKLELIMAGETVRKFWGKQISPGTSLEREVELIAREYLDDAKIKLQNSPNHFQNFVDCVQSRKRPICAVEIGASTVNACHVMNFAYRHGASVKWDPAHNTFASGGDPKWLTRDFRKPWVV
jgi:predicted dehydrogenase